MFYATALAAFTLRQLGRRPIRAGKIVVVATTAACWGAGIVATNSDWAFTLTNVLIHGVPYLAIVWVYGTRARHDDGSIGARVFGARRIVPFLGILAGLAYLEELGWDAVLWHTDSWLFFGAGLHVPAPWRAVIVGALAVPQVTHYVLDGFIWRTAPEKNPGLSEVMRLPLAKIGDLMSIPERPERRGDI
jgi:hypothetical protein